MDDEPQRKIGELHEYARHAFQLFMGWFTVFIVVNYATMGWLAKDGGIFRPSSPATSSAAAGGPNMSVILSVVVLFISQHILGILACSVLARYFRTTNASIVALEDEIKGKDVVRAANAGPRSTLPLRLYLAILALCAAAMACIATAWTVLGYFAKYPSP